MNEINTSNIPEELKSESFMLWRLEQREGRQTKPPINPSSGFRGNVQDPKQWTDFDNAMRIHMGGRFHTNGISVVLHPSQTWWVWIWTIASVTELLLKKLLRLLIGLSLIHI